MSQLTRSNEVLTKWEETFKQMNWGRYPQENLIRFIARQYFRLPAQERQKIRVLDMGCGVGAGAWFMSREGLDTYGMDGSETAIEQAKAYLEKEGLNAQWAVGSITKLPYEDVFFDSLVDTGATTSNPWADCVTILEEVYRVLKPGGTYYGFFLGQGTTVEGGETGEAHYYEDARGGPLVNAPTFRLFNEADLRTLFQHFGHVSVDRVERTMNNQEVVVHEWTVTAQKG